MRTILAVVICTAIGASATGCSGLAQLVKAEGVYKNANYVIEQRTYNIGIGFDQPAEGNIPLPKIGFWRVDTVAGVMAPGQSEALRYRNRRNMSVEGNASGGDAGGPGAVTGDETIIAIDQYSYLGVIESSEVEVSKGSQ